jgi:hypothetical protein
MALNSGRSGFMHVVGEIDGRNVEIDAFLSRVQDGTTRQAVSRLVEALETVDPVVCPWHHQDAEIALAGTSLPQMSVDIVACCDEQADAVCEIVNAHIKAGSHAASAWRRPWARIRATLS